MDYLHHKFPTFVWPHWGRLSPVSAYEELCIEGVDEVGKVHQEVCACVYHER